MDNALILILAAYLSEGYSRKFIFCWIYGFGARFLYLSFHSASSTMLQLLQLCYRREKELGLLIRLFPWRLFKGKIN